MMRLRSTSSKVTAVALAVAVGFGAANVALAGHSKSHVCASPCVWKPDGRMIHTHTRTKGFYSSVDNSSIRTQSEDARAEWARDTIMSLPIRAHSNASMHQLDRDYGRRRWSAQAVIKSGYNSSTGHYTHGHIRYNLHYMANPNRTGTHDLSTPYGRRAIACQEIGHLIGLAHAHGDCMGYTYSSDYSKRVSSATATFINGRYKRTGH